MGFVFHFSEEFGDVRDPVNQTGRVQPLTLEVASREDFVCVAVYPRRGEQLMCVIGVKSARQLICGIEDAIEHVEAKCRAQGLTPRDRPEPIR